MKTDKHSNEKKNYVYISLNKRWKQRRKITQALTIKDRMSLPKKNDKKEDRLYIYMTFVFFSSTACKAIKNAYIHSENN